MVTTSIRPRGPIQPDMTQLVRLTTIAAPIADQNPATNEAWEKIGHQLNHQRVDDKQENAERQQSDGQGEDHDDRTHEGVDDARVAAPRR